MKKGLERCLAALAVLSTCGLAFNMWAILGNKERLFLQEGRLAALEVIILAGFLLVLVFNLLALFWSLKKVLSEHRTPFHPAALVLCTLCLILMAGEKVLIDEIAREYRLAGWEAAQEWIILYGCFGVQMFFNLIMLFHLIRQTARK